MEVEVLNAPKKFVFTDMHDNALFMCGERAYIKVPPTVVHGQTRNAIRVADGASNGGHVYFNANEVVHPVKKLTVSI